MAQPGNRQRRLEVRDGMANMILVKSNPNGSIEAAEATFAWDYVNKHLYINTDGSTTWILII